MPSPVLCRCGGRNAGITEVDEKSARHNSHASCGLEGPLDAHWHDTARVDFHRDLNILCEPTGLQLDSGCTVANRVGDRWRRLVRRASTCGLGRLDEAATLSQRGEDGPGAE